MATTRSGGTRRGFLLACASTLTAGCAPPPVAAASAKRSLGAIRAPSVAVVGAGLSGLAVALWLTEFGFDVRVFEATQRAGGRISTIHSPFIDGQYVEAGAAHVINDPTLLELCRSIDVRLEQWTPQRGLSRVTLLGSERTAHPANTQAPDTKPPLSAEENQLGAEGRMRKYFAEAETLDPTASLPQRLWHLDELSGAALLRQRGASPGFVAEMDGMLGLGDTGIEGMSALGMIQEWASIVREIKLGGNARVVGGCDRLPTAIAHRLGDRISYGAEVRGLRQREHDVQIAFRRLGNEQSIVVDHAVLAIPPPLLRKLVIDPALPADKARAISEIALENVTRVWAQTDRRFWIERGESGRVDTDSAFGPVRDESEGMRGSPGLLGLYVRRAEASRLAKLSDEERRQAALDFMDLAQPGVKRHLLATASKCWSSEPFQQGAYAYFKVGQAAMFGPALARPVGRVHFAGDHASHRPGFMHGALAAAQRVVQEVVAFEGR